jgi:hypothetical protein
MSRPKHPHTLSIVGPRLRGCCQRPSP